VITNPKPNPSRSRNPNPKQWVWPERWAWFRDTRISQCASAKPPCLCGGFAAAADAHCH